MKNVFTLFLMLCVITIQQATAQNKQGRISGVVKDGSGRTIEAATVSLVRAKDTALVKVAVSNKNGEFEFDRLEIGRYKVQVSAVGFAKASSEAVEVTELVPAVQLTDFELPVAGKSLSEVTVTARRPMVENKIDKTIVNVDAFITNAGGTALDVLEKSPGITVDREGNVSLKGKSGVIILVDGKQTFLGGQDLANYLRNMPSNQLDQIEIMTQPSAKFDASGNSGVINIKTKKNKQSGFNGTINLAFIQGVYPKSPNSISINYRKNKVNLFSSYNYSYWEGFSDLSILRKFRDNTTKEITAVFDQLSNNKFKGINHSVRVGMDYSPNKKTTIGFAVNGIYNPRRFGANSRSNIYDGMSNLDSTNVAMSESKDPWKNLGINLNFRRILDTTGKEITADVDYLVYRSRSRQFSDNYTFHQPGDLLTDSFLLQGYLPSDIAILSARVDYSHPLKKGAKFEAGLKSSYVQTDNDAQYQVFNNGTYVWEKDLTRSNHFLYDENINAAYVNYSKQMKKWGVQTGLRMEHTSSSGKQITDPVPVKRDYVQLFPTMYVSYTADKNNNFGLSYGRRIERPNYRDMNPFQFFLDQYTYQQGNPYLTPQFSHNIEFSHNLKGKLTTTLNFSQTTDIINDVLKQNNETKVTYLTKENIARRRNVGIALSYNAPITKWWTASIFANVFNNHFEGFVNNRSLDANITSGMGNMNNQLRFGKGWGGEVSGFYRMKMQDGGLMVANPMGVISFGASKQILKTKGTLRLSVVDPFYIQKFSGVTKFGEIDAEINSQWDNRRVSLNFTYRFGKMQNNNAPRRRSGSAQEEQNRVGGGQQQ
jgi:hypothetical protein